MRVLVECLSIRMVHFGIERVLAGFCKIWYDFIFVFPDFQGLVWICWDIL